MKYCPTHYTPEGSSVDRCNGADFGIPCPPMVEEDPTKTVNIKCGPCDLNVIVPVGDLMSGKAKKELPRCSRDECACMIVQPEAVDPMPVAIEKGVQAGAKAKAAKAAAKAQPE